MMQGPENSDNSGFAQIKEAFTNTVGYKYTSIFHDGSNRNLLCGSNSSRQAASISRGEKFSLQLGDLLLASETARSVRRKKVSLLT